MNNSLLTLIHGGGFLCSLKTTGYDHEFVFFNPKDKSIGHIFKNIETEMKYNFWIIPNCNFFPKVPQIFDIFLIF